MRHHHHLSVQTDAQPVATTTPPVTPSTPLKRDSNPAQDAADTLLYTDSLDYHHHPDSSTPIQFGHGVWSVVYKASSLPAPSTTDSHSDPALITPPASPASKNRIVAVKSPIRKDAHAVLECEARVLTRLSLTPGAEQYIVSFLGYLPRSHALVMGAVPLALSSYITEEAVKAQERRSTANMFEPVLGKQRWGSLTQRLISGLDWMHNTAGVVHGDIKPHNVLLRRVSAVDDDEGFGYEPLYADFSSAHDTSSTTSSPAPGSALTPPFAAPELLSPAALKSPTGATPTTASDVFSLAVTLLAAATGDLLLYPGASHMQRLAMAREGHRVVEFARSGGNGTRVARGGVVERVVSGAVVKEPAERIGAGEWVELVMST
ncbi:protein kinase domain-containing protein [Aspergillus ruber CBS 135680]|uniref:Kinase-like protein n=1 Tax=Aspergillus ruber (strain CBS 135680) TaxID=1388766 RepID=A0A017S4G1_ASPRC|nr:kinase-like protein [Aspergillus ruber CBS 135680]EYE91923.1 kinase-like protein [Aspergillus ruber CBS 135680]